MKSQVLLCGTQYGQVYLPAIFESKEFELAALLSKGSAQSKRIAQQCGVSLYNTVGDIDEQIDLAVVAIGGQAGTQITNDLLKRRVPVLIEHPIDIANIDTLISTANSHNTYCHTNSHFSHIAPIADFIRLSEELNNVSRAHIISVNCNSRTLFSTLDILMRAFGVFNVSNFEAQPIANTSYQQISFLVQGIPCNIVYQRWRATEDNSKDSPLGHQITVTYPEGVLSLGGTFGPCLWFPLMAAEIPSQVPLFSTLQQSNNGVPTQTDIIRWRKIANHKSMLDLWNAKCNANPVEHQTFEFLTSLCKSWSLLFHKFSVEVKSYAPQAINKRFWTASSIVARSSDS